MPTSYCVYMAGGPAANLNPPIAMGDIVCVDCPADQTCKGAGRIRLKDRAGTIQVVQLTPTASTCTECPAGGKSGYTFAGAGGVY